MELEINAMDAVMCKPSYFPPFKCILCTVNIQSLTTSYVNMAMLKSVN